MRDRKTLAGGFAVIGQLLVVNALSVPATAYIIRSLGPAGYGEWAAAASLVGIVGAMVGLGLRPLFVREVARDPGRAAEALAVQVGLRALIAVLAAGVAIALCVALGYHQTVVACAAVAAVGLVLTAVGSAAADALQGLDMVREMAGVNLVAGIALTAASVVAVWRRAGPVGLSAAYLVGPATVLACALALTRRARCPVGICWAPRRYRELLRESRSLGAYQFSVTLRDRVEQLLVPRLAGMAGFGYFAAGSLPADRLRVVPEGLVTSFYPAICRGHSQGEAAAVSRVRRLVLASLAVCLPLAIGASVLARPFAAILFPHSPAICRDVLCITIWSVPLRALQLPMGCALQASGHHDYTARVGLCATACSLAGTAALVAAFGVRGACWAWVLRSALSALFLAPGFVRAYPGLFRLPGRAPGGPEKTRVSAVLARTAERVEGGG